MPKYLYKILIVLMAVSLFFGSAGLSRVKTVRATSIPVLETNPQLIIEAIKAVLTEINTYKTEINTYRTLINRISQLNQQFLEWNFFQNNEKIKLDLFEQVKDQITEELQTMNDGNPIGIEDYYDYLTDPGLKTLNIFSTELDENFLCESFNEQIKEMFKPDKTVKFSEKGPGGAGCTISDTVSDIYAFYDDFSQGGWDAFDALMEPQNNFFGAYIMTREELAGRQFAAYESAQTEALANQGYYSQRECEEEDEYGNCIKSKIITPGYVFAELSGKVAMADLDYLPNAGDLTNYLAEFGNTFLDRMFKESTGLFTMETKKSSGQPPADDPCALMEGELYDDCKELFNADSQTTEAIKETYLQMIDDLIDDKNQALGYYTTDQTWVTGLITTLTDLLACQTDQGVSTTDTQANITAANNQKIFIDGEITRINNEIEELEALKTELNNLTDQNEIIALGQDLDGEYDLTDSFTAQTIGDSINNAWTQAQTDLAACQAATPTPTP